MSSIPYVLAPRVARMPNAQVNNAGCLCIAMVARPYLPSRAGRMRIHANPITIAAPVEANAL